jgi:hypothetical protein
VRNIIVTILTAWKFCVVKKCHQNSLFNVVYLCTMGCKRKTLLIMVSLWCNRWCHCSDLSLWKIAMGSCRFGRCPFKIPRLMLCFSAARIRGSSFWYNRFLSGIACPNLCNLWSHLWCAMCWTSRRGLKMAVGFSVLDDATCKLYYHHNPV